MKGYRLIVDKLYSEIENPQLNLPLLFSSLILLLLCDSAVNFSFRSFVLCDFSLVVDDEDGVLLLPPSWCE